MDQAAPSDGATIGRLDADRLCARCYHQLSGQGVYREPRLDILYVRCPECGAYSPVTEHPTANRWVKRLGGFLAAILVLGLLGILGIDVLASSIGLHEASWASARCFEQRLQSEGSAMQPGPNAAWAAPPQLVGDRALLLSIGDDAELRRTADERFRDAVLPAIAIGAMSGLLWTVLLAHRRWYLAWLWLFVPQTLAFGFAYLIFAMSGPPESGAFYSYSSLSYHTYGLPYLLLAVGAMLAARIGAFMVLRPVVHYIARALLPAKLHRALRALWFDEIETAGDPSR